MVLFGFRGAIARVAGFWYSHGLFPLTPALSLRETENQAPRCDNSKRLGLSDALPMLLPLPEGEGRGEGERSVPIPERCDVRNRLSDFGFPRNPILAALFCLI